MTSRLGVGIENASWLLAGLSVAAPACEPVRDVGWGVGVWTHVTYGVPVRGTAHSNSVDRCAYDSGVCKERRPSITICAI